MDPVSNPYSPGAGTKPAALVGRQEVSESWLTALVRVERGRTHSPFALVGLRGVGKTVLLAELDALAQKRNWISARIEADSDHSLRELLGEALYEPIHDLVRPNIGERVLKLLKTAASFKASYSAEGVWNFGLDLSATPGGGADTGEIDTDLRKLVRELSAVAGDDGHGLAILIDEAQDLSVEDLRALCVVAHRASQEGWPFLVALAGLPSLRSVLAEAKSYAERFSFFGIRELTEEAARKALTLPADEENVDWSQEALTKIIAASGRYPYFLQQFGKDSWDAAEQSPISSRDADLGIAVGTNSLDNGFFNVRWDRATKGEKAYMRAMAIDQDQGSSSGEVAARLGKSPSSCGPIRAQLIAKGLIYSPDHGVIAFTVPHMYKYIEKQPR